MGPWYLGTCGLEQIQERTGNWGDKSDTKNHVRDGQIAGSGGTRRCAMSHCQQPLYSLLWAITSTRLDSRNIEQWSQQQRPNLLMICRGSAGSFWQSVPIKSSQTAYISIELKDIVLAEESRPLLESLRTRLRNSSERQLGFRFENLTHDIDRDGARSSNPCWKR